MMDHQLNSIEALVTKTERLHRLMTALVDLIPGMETNLPLIE